MGEVHRDGCEESEVNQVRSLLIHDLQLLPHQQKKGSGKPIFPFSRKHMCFFLFFVALERWHAKKLIILGG